MRDIIRHRGGVAPLLAASVVFALWNTAYKYAVDGLPASTALSVMLLTAAAALWACALVKGRQRLTQRQLRRIALAGAVKVPLTSDMAEKVVRWSQEIRDIHTSMFDVW